MSLSLTFRFGGLLSRAVICLLVLVGTCTSTQAVFAQVASGSQESVPLREAIRTFERISGYTFTYRDKLVENKRIAAPIRDRSLNSFVESLGALEIDARIDSVDKHVLLFPRSPPAGGNEQFVRGRIVDDQSRDGLSYATISWRTADGRNGVASTENGSFEISLSDLSGQPDDAFAEISYLGYQPGSIRVAELRASDTIVIGLERVATGAPEILVSGVLIASDLDTAFVSLLERQPSSPLGEGNVLKSLQSLPSVSISTGLSEGLNVRGSPADAFQVILDGMPIYSQSHFFGMFDALNEDALQRVALFYGVPPASYHGATGGTLSFVTRNGSRNRIDQSYGISNTSIKGTLSGPLGPLPATWIVSLRRSILSEIDWFGNATLIEQGLNVDRQLSVERATPLRSAVLPGASEASYYDGHAKLNFDVAKNGRLSLSGYVGSDRSGQSAIRLSRAAATDPNDLRIVRSDVHTAYDWGSDAMSAQYQQVLNSGSLVAARVGRSRFNSDYHKDDFAYVVPPLLLERDNAVTFIDTLSNSNSLNDILASTEVTLPVPGGEITGGASVHAYESRFSEFSAVRELPFNSQLQTTLLESFLEYASTRQNGLGAQVGLRTQYYTAGDIMNWSPRLKLSLGGSRVSSYIGYSKSYQYLHRLYLENTVGSYLWTISTDDEPPGESDNFVGGLTIRPHPRLAIQLDGYVKRFKNLRQHESLVSRRRLRSDGATLSPWVHDTRGQSRGVEALVLGRVGRSTITTGYSYSRSTIENDSIQDGRTFLAEWDRTHQFTSRVSTPLGEKFSIDATWMIASGATNVLAYTDPLEPERLDRYDRLDLGMVYQTTIAGAAVDLKLNVFNAYNKSNTWYRTNVAVLQRVVNREVVSFVNADVYDLGIRPSFEIKIRM